MKTEFSDSNRIPGLKQNFRIRTEFSDSNGILGFELSYGVHIEVSDANRNQEFKLEFEDSHWTLGCKPNSRIKTEFEDSNSIRGFDETNSRIIIEFKVRRYRATRILKYFRIWKQCGKYVSCKVFTLCACGFKLVGAGVGPAAAAAPTSINKKKHRRLAAVRPIGKSFRFVSCVLARSGREVGTHPKTDPPPFPFSLSTKGKLSLFPFD